MHAVISAIGRQAAANPGRPALSDGRREVGYGLLHRSVAEAAAEIRTRTARPVALSLDNSPEWIIADLAVLAARVPCLPLPAFFSPDQQAHALRDAGVECVVTDEPEACIERLRAAGLPAAPGADLPIAGRRLGQVWVAPGGAPAMPAGTVKVSYTSGTTSRPKGVCLGEAALAAVVRSLVDACRLDAADRHLGVLPLATLLENIAVHAALAAGGLAILRPLRDIGIEGASGARPDKLLDALRSGAATTAVVVPQLLKGIVQRCEAGERAPGALRFLAVGGAKVAPALLDRAGQIGLPVFEGYGLTECGSVVSLNTPGARRAATAGRPLPHAAVSFGADGEILVDGAVMLGYCGRADKTRGPWHTGDLGALDADGYLRITGRKRDCFITAYGRNVSPEWIEAALAAEPGIEQAWVCGEARPWPAAVIVAGPHCPDAVVDRAVAQANAGLPAYARVRRWVRAQEPFSPANGELTANGRPRRERIAARYGAAIDALYLEEPDELLR